MLTVAVSILLWRQNLVVVIVQQTDAEGYPMHLLMLGDSTTKGIPYASLNVR